MRLELVTATLGAAVLAGPAQATWSIVIVDSHSGEVAIGAATCLTGFDLKRLLPVVRIEKGAGAAQSLIDSGAVNRKKIWDGLGAGQHPEAILAKLAVGDSQYQKRQYGIGDAAARTLTFTGADCGAFAGGKTGKFGSIVYAVQGNVITGQPVLDMAELAILDTPGGIPEKLMAAMEAARAMGGDGRCSCSPTDPDGCGSPPPSFVKSAHIGFMIDARRGNSEGVCTSAQGCANGNYYMAFNILTTTSLAPDPVLQLRAQFDAWRAGLVGVTDAVESIVTLSTPTLLSGSGASATLLIDLRDWKGDPVTEGVTSVVVTHDPAAGFTTTTIGPTEHLGGSLYQATVTAGGLPHHDRLVVIVSDADGTRPLMPPATLTVQYFGCDLNGDGVVDAADVGILAAHYGCAGPAPAPPAPSPCVGDIDLDGDTDQVDLGFILANLP